MTSKPSIRVAVQIERQTQPNEWEAWRFVLRGVLWDEGQFGEQKRILRDDGKSALALHPGLVVTLHVDEAEGYYLNLSTGAPVWFVMWRTSEEDPSLAWPEFVTLSYNEAGRLLDAQERVDNVPLDPSTREWLQAFVDDNYRPEPKRRQRPASFKAPELR